MSTASWRAPGRAARHDGAAASPTPLKPLVNSLIATLARTPVAQRLEFKTSIAGEPSVPLDHTDLAEVLGNLLENAARHAKSQIRVAGTDATKGPAITVEDDGPGYGLVERARVLNAAHGLTSAAKAPAWPRHHSGRA